MTSNSGRIVGWVAASFAVPYVVAKIQFAVQGRLGIHGGPRITDADRSQYESSQQISIAQWTNVAVGVLILAVTLLPLLGHTRRWPRRLLAGPLMLIGTGLIGTGGYMIINGAIAGVGGYPFGGYAVVWGVLVWVHALLQLSARRRRTTAPAITARS